MSELKKGLKAVAVLEATKGTLALLVGLGIHTLAGKNVENILVSLVNHLHFNPASQFPGVIAHAATVLTDANLTLIALGACIYSVIRLVEAYGLWKGFIWIEWFALLSGAIYLPVELFEVIVHKNWLSVLLLLMNILVVLYLYFIIRGKPSSHVR